MKNFFLVLLLFLAFFFLNLVKLNASGGFYLSKSDKKMFNRSSQIAMARDHHKTVLTILNDYLGESKEFAILIPLPEIGKSDIRVLDQAPFDRLEEYSSPRLIKYFDEKVCPAGFEKELLQSKESPIEANKASQKIKIKIEYAEGKYEVLTAPANKNEELEDWLIEKGYKIPKQNFSAIEGYLNRKMKFILVKISLKEKVKSNFVFLRPIQIEFESPNFILPIPLTKTNDRFPQDVLIYLLTRQGRVEMTNFHNAPVPSQLDLPFYIERDFKGFYQAMLSEQFKKSEKKLIFTEYAGNVSEKNSDSRKNLSIEELRKLGVFWLDASNSKNVFVTRFHLYGENDYFPEILRFDESGNRETIHTNYILHYPYPIKKSEACPAVKEYRQKVAVRNEQEAKNLSELTGWPIENIRKVIKESSPRKKRWYQYIWGDQE